MSIFIQARGDDLDSGDLVVIYDGFKHHNKQMFMSAFRSSDGTAITKVERTVRLIYDEDGFMDRIERLKGSQQIVQEEHVYLVSSVPLKMLRKHRKHHKGCGLLAIQGCVHLKF